MRLFGRKGTKDEAQTAEHAFEPAPPEDASDPSTWALPADAAVAAGGAVVEPATALGADRASSVPPAPLGDEPVATAAGDAEPEPQPEAGASTSTGPAYGAASSPGGSTLAAAQQKPEIVAAGAFVGAFLVARILRRITE